MKLKLNTWQRLQLVVMLGSLQGNVSVLRKAGKALDVLEMSDEEEELVGLRRIASGSTWANTEHHFELEIKDREAAGLVREIARSRQDWPVANRSLVFDLFEQLGIKEEEK